MASVLKVDKLDPQSGTDLEIGSSGDTITIPSGATFTQSGTMNASAITAGTIDTARLGSGTASSSTVLYGDQTYKAEPGGTNTPYFRAALSGSQATTDATTTKVTFDSEIYDSDGAYDPSTNYRFTPQTAGYYMISASLSIYKPATILNAGDVYIYFNGAAVAGGYMGNHGSQYSNSTPGASILIYFNGSTDYVEAYTYIDTSTGVTGNVSGPSAGSWFQGFRILT